MEIIIRGKDEELKRLKGKSVCDLARNLESEGWPSEFRNDVERDKARYLERRLGRPLRKGDAEKIAKI